MLEEQTIDTTCIEKVKKLTEIRNFDDFKLLLGALEYIVSTCDQQTINIREQMKNKETNKLQLIKDIIQMRDQLFLGYNKLTKLGTEEFPCLCDFEYVNESNQRRTRFSKHPINDGGKYLWEPLKQRFNKTLGSSFFTEMQLLSQQDHSIKANNSKSYIMNLLRDHQSTFEFLQKSLLNLNLSSENLRHLKFAVNKTICDSLIILITEQKLYLKEKIHYEKELRKLSGHYCNLLLSIDKSETEKIQEASELSQISIIPLFGKDQKLFQLLWNEIKTLKELDKLPFSIEDIFTQRLEKYLELNSTNQNGEGNITNKEEGQDVSQALSENTRHDCYEKLTFDWMHQDPNGRKKRKGKKKRGKERVCSAVKEHTCSKSNHPANNL